MAGHNIHAVSQSEEDRPVAIPITIIIFIIARHQPGGRACVGVSVDAFIHQYSVPLFHSSSL